MIPLPGEQEIEQDIEEDLQHEDNIMTMLRKRHQERKQCARGGIQENGASPHRGLSAFPSFLLEPLRGAQPFHPMPDTADTDSEASDGSFCRGSTGSQHSHFNQVRKASQLGLGVDLQSIIQEVEFREREEQKQRSNDKFSLAQWVSALSAKRASVHQQ